MEIKEHDVIKYKGLIGTVVHIYPNEEAYDVEFIIPITKNGVSLKMSKSNVETLMKNQIENEIRNEVNYESKSIN